MLVSAFAAAVAVFCTGALALPQQKQQRQQQQQQQQRPPVSSLVVFGDSYSDNGNEYRLSNDTWPADPAYYHGRFSDGLEWNELVAQNLSIPLHNYAYGGATTSNALVQGYSGPNGTLPVPSLEEQVAQYLAAVPSDAPIASATFAFLGGANDILLDLNTTAVQPAGVLSGLVTRLRNRGAQHFLLLNYPDLSQIPYDSYIPLFTQRQLGAFSRELGTQLAALARGLNDSGRSPTMPMNSTAVNAVFVDLEPLFRSFSYYEGGWRDAGFGRFGLYGSCLTGAYEEVPQRTLCNDSSAHVFFDEYHPTAAGHRAIAKQVLFALEKNARME